MPSSNSKTTVPDRANQADAITAEVIAHRLRSSSDEMMATLVKTAYSPNIKERRDCSTGIFDAQGRLLALTAIAPMHLSSLIGTIESVMARFPIDTMRPDDAFAVNDPYSGGGSHLPDITMVAPVFVGDRVVAFVANIAHHSDVGGKVPGSESSDCTSIFQEGIRLPPVQLFKQGELNQSVLDIILLNSRTPREREGDLKAQIATNVVGRRRVAEIFERFGAATTLAGIEAWLDYSETRAREGIKGLPNGVYENEDFIDHDGITPRMVKARIRLTVHDDHLTFDFTGSDPQMAGSRNLVWNATLAGVYYAVKAMIDPDLPPNAGYFRAVDVIATPGSIFNAQSPAAVGDRGSSGNVLGDVIFGAFAKAVPERVMAGCGPLAAVTFSGFDPRRNDQYFVDYETFAGAAGAQHDQDGKDAVRVHVSGAANLPIEAAEHEFPVNILRYELIPDSGGAGRFRGGLGTRRDVANWAVHGRLVGRGLRQVVAAPGLFGGANGRTGKFVMRGSGDDKVLPANFSDLPIGEGEVIRLETPSGAGFGDPFERDPDLVLADVLAGKVSTDCARDLYGVAIRGSGINLTIDQEQTTTLRRIKDAAE